MNDESGVRSVALIVYGAVLGYCALTWWRAERQRLVWDAAEEAAQNLARREAWLKDNQPAAAATPST